MPETIKTTLLKAIETMLRAQLPELATVRRDWQFPFDLSNVALPVLVFYEDAEDLGQVGGQLARNRLDLDLVVFAAFSGPIYQEDDPAWEDNGAWQAFKDWADGLAGQVHGLWQDREIMAPLKAAGLLRLEELGNRKAPSNQDYGELVLSYRLTYGHALGDAFTTVFS